MSTSDIQKEEPAALDDSLAQELHNREAIQAIMELYDVSEQTAQELWASFIKTVARMKYKDDLNKQNG
jgi:hypothetical protein